LNNKQSAFEFEKVYKLIDNLSLYESEVKELISQFSEGSNSTILSFGQTGAGKTFTMLGEDLLKDGLA